MKDFDEFLDTIDFTAAIPEIVDSVNSGLGYESGDPLPHDKLTEYVAMMSAGMVSAMLREYHGWLSEQI